VLCWRPGRWPGFLQLGEPLILWSAHEYKTALEMFRRVRTCVRRLGRRVNDNLYDYDGILDQGQQHERRGGLRASRHRAADPVHRQVEERRPRLLRRLPDLGRGVRAVRGPGRRADADLVLARPNPQIWYTSSPPLDAVSGAQLFRVRRAANWPSDGLAYFEWGAEGCLDDLEGVDLDDRDLWRRVLPAWPAAGSLRRPSSGCGTRCRTPGSPARSSASGRRTCRPASRSSRRPTGSRRRGPDFSVAMPVAIAAAVSLDRQWASIAACGRRPDGLLHIEVTSEEFAGGQVLLDNRPRHRLGHRATGGVEAAQPALRGGDGRVRPDRLADRRRPRRPGWR
jgi:hypothetical protein